MGCKILEIKLPTDFTPDELKSKIRKKLKIDRFTYTIERQSLDARDKRNIRWLIRLGVSSPGLPGQEKQKEEELEVPYKKRAKRVVVVGSGPAGFFCGLTLMHAGFWVNLLEQGSVVAERLKRVSSFERSGELDERNNYAFGEGGAGTFSDGKLTSRTGSISKERRFIFDSFIKAGAPEEIAYLAHPHVGSDNLVKIVKKLREDFISRGGEFFFNTKVKDIYLKNRNVQAVETEQGKIEADYFVFAPGHSAYETYRMLIKRRVPFRTKPLALGCRVEHPQELINLAQWGRESLPGIKAAAYKLTFKQEGCLPVYSFCMCPGGTVVPAAPYKGLNIVNGKSKYARNQPFANAAVVAGVDLNRLLEREIDPLRALDWLENLEKKFFDLSHSYAAPACKIEDFLAGRLSASLGKSSYPFGLIPADFRELLPAVICSSLEAGIKDFCKKIKGFETGIMLGLESKTSSPLQALRHQEGRCQGIDNLYICGEGSGLAGGIVSSAADGIKEAFAIIRSD